MEAQPQETSNVNNKSSPKEPSLDEVEDIIGYKFKNKKLLEEAFTHSSLTSGFSYERLEYVGDAVLSLLISREQYSLYPDLAPGKLTRHRSANVDTEKLARVALRHGFHRYLRHKKPCLVDQIQEFSRAVLEYPLHSNGLINAPKNLADVVEATIGAVFMDCNSIEVVWDVFKGLLEPIITPETIKLHPATELREMCQKSRRRLKYVDSWEKDYSVECVVDGRVVGRGTYSLRKDVAFNRAAKYALDNKWKWMEYNNNGVIARSVWTEKPPEPLLVKNMAMENSDEDENRIHSPVEEDLGTNNNATSVHVSSEETSSYNKTNTSSPPQGQIEMHYATNSLLGSGIGDEFKPRRVRKFIGLSKKRNGTVWLTVRI